MYWSNLAVSIAETATGTHHDDDLLVQLFMTKSPGPLQHHLRLNVDTLTAADQMLSPVTQRYASSALLDSDVQFPTHLSAIEQRTG